MSDYYEYFHDRERLKRGAPTDDASLLKYRQMTSNGAGRYRSNSLPAVHGNFHLVNRTWKQRDRSGSIIKEEVWYVIFIIFHTKIFGGVKESFGEVKPPILHTI